MNRTLLVGCGDIARRVQPRLSRCTRSYALLRQAAHFPCWRALGATPVPGDLDDRKTLGRLAGLADTVLHFAPPPGDGRGDVRTRHLLAALSRGRLPKRLVYLSTSGVYGDCAGAEIDETRPPAPASGRGQRRFDAERQLRRWGRRNGVRVCILRVPGIHAPERLPLARLQAGLPAFLAEVDAYSNHIHADDLATIVLAALRAGRPNRLYHACDDDMLKMGDYFDLLADAHGLPRPPRAGREAVRAQVSDQVWSFMRESRRLSNRRMKRELNVRLAWPTTVAMLAAGLTPRNGQV